MSPANPSPPAFARIFGAIRVLAIRRDLPYSGRHGSPFHARAGRETCTICSSAGRNPVELVEQVMTRYVDKQSRFVDAVSRGEEAMGRGDFLTHEQVVQRLQRLLQPR